MHGAVHPGVGFLPEPLLGQLVEVGPALEGAVADEEVMLDVADVALVLALGLGSGRATGPRAEAIVPGQIEEPGMELDGAAAPMRDDGGLLIVDQDLGRDAPEPLEGPHQRLVGMLGVLAVRPPEVEAARVTEGVHREVHRDGLARDHRRLHGPVGLHLPAGLSLEAHRRPPGPQRPLGLQIVADDRDAAAIAARLHLPPDHDCVPHSLAHEAVNHRPIRIQETAPPAAPRCRRATPRHRPAHRLPMHPQLLRDVAEIDTALDQCLNRHEVLQSQHPVPPPDGDR